MPSRGSGTRCRDAGATPEASTGRRASELLAALSAPELWLGAMQKGKEHHVLRCVTSFTQALKQYGPVLSIWRICEENTSSHLSLQHLVSPGPRCESGRSSLGDTGSIQTLFSLWIIETLVLHLLAQLSFMGRGAHEVIECPLQKGLVW